MEEHGLGPNGAQVLAADMLAMNARELAETMDTFRTNYFLIDTPGQAELLSEEELERVVKWSQDPLALYEALMEDATTPKTLLDVEFMKGLETIGVYRRFVPVSSQA